ncbi:MAG: type II toxin-antitoxin system HicA family toxin [Candidatus Liptonbacteria bacterium]|nr:type II toxin-antitoxin system HicA family toxin [Candidatus Liptonbacteria bacterium]
MPHLAPIHWKKFEKFLLYVGCTLERERGDHRIYERAGLTRPLVVPRVTAIPIFILRNNLRVLGVSVETYLEILEKC